MTGATGNLETLRPWFLLRSIAGLGDITCARLLHSVGSPERILAASEATLRGTGALTQVQAVAICRGPDTQAREGIQKELDSLDRLGITVIPFGDDAYPRRLKTLPDPPLLLYSTGTMIPSDQLAVAVVGSRRPTPAGRAWTERLSRDLASAGFTIVSGLARGIDGAAHKGAVAAGGRTWAVLGCGLDQTYPSEHRALREQIEAHGAVLSELPLGASPHAYHFPRRNRIISGLSVGVVVTEAAAKSGSLITARLASEQGREVFAVPGSVREETSRGPHGLIKQGATLVESAQDIIDELLPQLEDQERERIGGRPMSGEEMGVPSALKEEESVLFKFVTYEPIQMEDLILKSGLAAHSVSTLLLSMELKGWIRRLPGHCLVRVEREKR